MLTTCARDYITWKNEYPEGADRVRGVTVRRFANARDARHRRVQPVLRVDLQQRAHAGRRDGVAAAAGPVVPGAARLPRAPPPAVRRLIFFTYLYAPTVLGLRVAPTRASWCRPRTTSRRSTSASTRRCSALPAGVAYNTEVERRFLDDALLRSARSTRRRSAAASICRRRRPMPATVTRDDEPADDAGGRRRAGRRTTSCRPLPPHLADRGAHVPAPPPAARAVRCSTAAASIPARAARS